MSESTSHLTRGDAASKGGAEQREPVEDARDLMRSEAVASAVGAGKSRRWLPLTVALLIVYLLILTGVILFKLPFYSAEFSDGVRVINLIPYAGSFSDNGTLLLREIVNNVLLFVPFGVYISLLRPAWSLWKRVALVVALTVGYEVAQFVFALGRTDITDVIDNAVGGLIGIGSYSLASRAFREKTATVVNVAAMILTVVVVGYFGYLLYLSYFVMGRPR